MYFPEPNLVIELTPETLKAQFGNPKMESRGLAHNAIKALGKLRPTMLWDTSAIVVTTTPDRMQFEGGTMMREWVYITDVTPQKLCELFNTSQTHARRYNWVHQIADAYRLDKNAKDDSGRNMLKILQDLYGAAFAPIDSDQPDSFGPVGELAAKLAASNPTLADLTSIAHGLKVAGTTPRAATLPVADSDDLAGRIAAVAQAAGAAARKWLIDEIAKLKQ